MAEKGFQALRIDPEFRMLAPPLRKEERQKLELNLSVDGCREPILVWNDKILDGHNRYEICNRLHIPYAVCTLAFDCRAAAIAWVCSSRLKRQNNTEETRKYLIGKRYEAEKIASEHRDAAGWNPHSTAVLTNTPDVRFASLGSGRKTKWESNRQIALRLGNEYRVSQITIVKYASYAHAIDALAGRAPNVARQVLCGSYKVSYRNLVALSEMDGDSLQALNAKFCVDCPGSARHSDPHRNAFGEATAKPGPHPAETPAIKTMPVYDPDAEVAGLTLTIPSWISSIERTRRIADLDAISTTACQRLSQALRELRACAAQMLTAMKEDV